MSTNNRIFGLDVMRAGAILAVLYTHLSFYLKSPLPFQLDGVGIFFILSGYLIGGILIDVLNKPAFTFRHLLDFWVRRWMRTLPAYYIVLTFLIIFTNPHSRLWGFNPSHVWVYYFFTQTMFKSGILFFPESWSLTVEEWFYLIVPALLFLSIKFKFPQKKVLLFWIIFLIAAGLISKLIVYNTGNFDDKKLWDENLRKPTVLRLDSIMFGVLAAYIRYYKVFIWQRLQGVFFLLLGLVFLAGSVIVFYLKPYAEMRLLGLIAIYFNTIGALLILPALSNFKLGKGVLYKPVTFISKISYSIYLINLSAFPIVWVYVNHIHYRVAAHLHISQQIFTGEWYYYYYHNFWYLLFSIGGAYILYLLVERPFMHLRNKIQFAYP